MIEKDQILACKSSKISKLIAMKTQKIEKIMKFEWKLLASPLCKKFSKENEKGKINGAMNEEYLNFPLNY